MLAYAVRWFTLFTPSFEGSLEGLVHPVRSRRATAFPPAASRLPCLPRASREVSKGRLLLRISVPSASLRLVPPYFSALEWTANKRPSTFAPKLSYLESTLAKLVQNKRL